MDAFSATIVHRAGAHSDLNPTLACVPSQKGLFCEWPQRQSHVFAVFASVVPVPETISSDPSILSGPFFVAVILRGPSRVASASMSPWFASPVALKPES